MLYAVTILLAVYLLNGFFIFKSSLETTSNQYPLWAFYLIQSFTLLVYFLFAGKIYQETRNKKNIYLILVSSCFFLVVITYILFYILQFISFTYFPQWDPNIAAYKGMGMEYHGPQFRPLYDLFIAPFTILYYGSPYFLQTLFNFINQGLILSLLIPGLILFLKKIKS